MIGLCNKCRHIGLDAQWERISFTIRHARCDNCMLYPGSNCLTPFRATVKDLRRYIDMHPKDNIVSRGTLSDGRTGDPLYCISYWEKAFNAPSDWKMRELYMHGKDEKEVRLAFIVSMPHYLRFKIIGIAPAVGWFVENEKEGRLTA